MHLWFSAGVCFPPLNYAISAVPAAAWLTGSSRCGGCHAAANDERRVLVFVVRCCILLQPSIWLLQPADRMLTRVVLVGCCSRCRDNACSVQLRLGCCSRAHTNDVGWLLQPVVWTCICVLMGCFQPVCIFPLQRAHTLSGRRCRYLWPLSAVTAGAWFTWSSGCRLAQIS